MPVVNFEWQLATCTKQILHASMVCGHRTHKSVRLAVTREQLYLEKETGNPDNDFAMTTVIEDY